MKKLVALMLALALLCMTFVALADYPDKPITLICGYAAGGSSDLLCRILANSLQEKRMDCRIKFGVRQYPFLLISQKE